MDDLIKLLIPILVSVGVALTRIWQVSRENAAQRKSDREAIALERRNLDQKLATQAELLTQQGMQLAELSGFKVLYQTLLESHNLLKEDHQQLRSAHDKLKTSFDKLERELETEREQRLTLQAQVNEKVSENARLFEANKLLRLENDIYKDLIRAKLFEADKRETRELPQVNVEHAGENKTGDDTPQET